MAKVPMLKELKSKYDQDPNGRAFGALAEAYRKSGQIKKSIDLIKKHISEHRDYALAYLTLARCYYEIRKYEEAFEILTPLVDSNRDSLSLQETYGDICEALGHDELAMDCFKRVLFFKPKNKNILEKIQNLEEQFSPLLNTENSTSSIDSWSQVDATTLSDSNPKDRDEKNDFMSYFDQKMESFNSDLIDNLSANLIKDNTASDEGLLTELTLNSSSELDNAGQISKHLTGNSFSEAVPAAVGVEEADLAPRVESSESTVVENDLGNLHSEFNDKVDAFLALLASKRSYKLAQAS